MAAAVNGLSPVIIIVLIPMLRSCRKRSWMPPLTMSLRLITPSISLSLLTTSGVDGVYPAGRNTVTFDGTRLASGVYLCRLSTLPLDARTSGITSGPGGTGRPGGLTAVRKMILIR